LDELNRKKTEPKDLGQEPAVFVNGQLIDDKYEVRKQLPPGASGQVYCVHDEVLERLCALKIYNNSETAIDSFKNEARLLLKLDHPHIVKVYSWGILKQSQRFYLLSEYVDGTELTRYTLPGNLLPRQKAIEAVLELLSALEYLHPDTERLEELKKKMHDGEVDQQEYDEYSRLNEHGLIHRDIKPSNVVLSSQGIKLIDFNISSRAITVGNTFAGTIGYMLPEIGMTRWSVDGDLFATGIMLYELLTGYHPYPDRQPFADTTPTNPMQYMPDISPDLADVVLRAVSCNPQLRYHSAKKFRIDVQNVA
jgi:serine/threonine-protein kinase